MEIQEPEVTVKETTSRDWLIAIGSGLGMLGFGAWGLKENDSAVLQSFIAQAPGILGVLLISRLFLTHMNRRETQYNATMLKLAEDCHQVNNRAITSLEKNTIMMGRSMQTLDQFDRQLGVRRREPKKREVEREVDESGQDVNS